VPEAEAPSGQANNSSGRSALTASAGKGDLPGSGGRRLAAAQEVLVRYAEAARRGPVWQ